MRLWSTSYLLLLAAGFCLAQRGSKKYNPSQDVEIGDSQSVDSIKVTRSRTEVDDVRRKSRTEIPGRGGERSRLSADVQAPRARQTPREDSKIRPRNEEVVRQDRRVQNPEPKVPVDPVPPRRDYRTRTGRKEDGRNLKQRDDTRQIPSRQRTVEELPAKEKSRSRNNNEYSRFSPRRESEELNSQEASFEDANIPRSRTKPSSRTSERGRNRGNEGRRKQTSEESQSISEEVPAPRYPSRGRTDERKEPPSRGREKTQKVEKFQRMEVVRDSIRAEVGRPTNAPPVEDLENLHRFRGRGRSTNKPREVLVLDNIQINRDVPTKRPTISKPSRGNSKGPTLTKDKKTDEVNEEDNYPTIYKQLKKQGKGPTEILALLKSKVNIRSADQEHNEKNLVPSSINLRQRKDDIGPRSRDLDVKGFPSAESARRLGEDVFEKARNREISRGIPPRTRTKDVTIVENIEPSLLEPVTPRSYPEPKAIHLPAVSIRKEDDDTPAIVKIEAQIPEQQSRRFTLPKDPVYSWVMETQEQTEKPRFIPVKPKLAPRAKALLLSTVAPVLKPRYELYSRDRNNNILKRKQQPTSEQLIEKDEAVLNQKPFFKSNLQSRPPYIPNAKYIKPPTAQSLIPRNRSRKAAADLDEDINTVRRKNNEDEKDTTNEDEETQTQSHIQRVPTKYKKSARYKATTEMATEGTTEEPTTTEGPIVVIEGTNEVEPEVEMENLEINTNDEMEAITDDQTDQSEDITQETMETLLTTNAPSTEALELTLAPSTESTTAPTTTTTTKPPTTTTKRQTTKKTTTTKKPKPKTTKRPNPPTTKKPKGTPKPKPTTKPTTTTPIPLTTPSTLPPTTTVPSTTTESTTTMDTTLPAPSSKPEKLLTTLTPLTDDLLQTTPGDRTSILSTLRLAAERLSSGTYLTQPVTPSMEPTRQTQTQRAGELVVYGVLPNNDVVRKVVRTTEAPNAPFIIFGLYPNGTIVRKFPNGTVIPEEMTEMNEVIGNARGGRTSLEKIVERDNLSYLYPPPMVLTTAPTSPTMSWIQRINTSPEPPKTSQKNDIEDNFLSLRLSDSESVSENTSSTSTSSTTSESTTEAPTTASTTPSTTTTTQSTTTKKPTQGTTKKAETKKTKSTTKKPATTVPTTSKAPTTKKKQKSGKQINPSTTKATTTTASTTTSTTTTKEPTTKATTTPTTTASTTTSTTTTTKKPTTKATTKPTTTKVKTKAPTTKATTKKPKTKSTTTKPTTKVATTKSTTTKPTTKTTTTKPPTKATTKKSTTKTTTTKPTTKKPTTKKLLLDGVTPDPSFVKGVDELDYLNNLLKSEVSTTGLVDDATLNSDDLADKVIQLAIERARMSTTRSSAEESLQALASTTSSSITSPKDDSSGGKISVWVIPPENGGDPSSTQNPLTSTNIAALNALTRGEQLFLADIISTTVRPQLSTNLRNQKQLNYQQTNNPFFSTFLRQGGLGGSSLVRPVGDPDNEPVDPERESALVQAAVNVTRAVSQFMSHLIQGATDNFQKYVRERMKALMQVLSSTPGRAVDI